MSYSVSAATDGGGQRLHLDAGAGGARASARIATVPASRSAVELDVDPVERQWMAERDQLGGALCGTDARQPGGDEGVALRSAGVEERGQHLRAHPDRARRPPRGGRVTGLSPTSTMRGAPSESRWVGFIGPAG